MGTILSIITHLVTATLIYAGVLWFVTVADVESYKRQVKTVKFHILTIAITIVILLMISAWW